MNRLKNTLKSKKGEGYIDIVISVIVLLSIAILTINLYSFYTLKAKMDEIANVLIDTATQTGEFGDTFNAMVEVMHANNPEINFTVSIDAEEWYNSTLKQVQYGTRMSVGVHTSQVLNGGGMFRMNIPCSVVRSGLSEGLHRGVDNHGEETTVNGGG